MLFYHSKQWLNSSEGVLSSIACNSSRNRVVNFKSSQSPMAADFQDPLCLTLTQLTLNTHSAQTSGSLQQAVFSRQPVSVPCVCCMFTCGAILELPAKSCLSPTPCCSSTSAGTVQCRAPALTPRAAYGKAIRASVPLKKGTERNTTALNTMPRLSFPPASFFFSFPLRQKFLQDPVLLSAFSIYFPSRSLPDRSHPLSLSLIPLNPNLPLGSAQHLSKFTLILKVFACRSHRSAVF